MTLRSKLATDRDLSAVKARATLLIGSGAPDNADGSDGDVYLDTAAGEFYVKASGSWSSAGTLS